MFYFATNIFISAFLLLQIQPIIGKLLLPWFGGAPAVWSTVLLFFQLLLIGGNAYTYWLINYFTPRRQRIIHLSVLVLAIIIMAILAWLWPSPITPDNSLKPHSIDYPIWHIFLLLTMATGMPYFILSTNTPLMQAWYSDTYPGRSPYRLYALSNTGSLLGLISYPIIIEPLLSLHWQGFIWSIGFVIFTLLTVYIIYRVYHAPNQANVSTTVSATSKLSVAVQALWIILTLCPTILLLATTQQLTQEVAAIPFLWVLPLTLYLLSFILVFQNEGWYNRSIFSALLFISTLMWMYALTTNIHFIWQIIIYSFLLFVCCMVCHGELYRLKPEPRQLTRFYLIMAIGGASGGLAVNFLAPLLFKGYWELEFGVALCWLLLVIMLFVRPSRSLLRRHIIGYSLIITTTVLVSIFAVHFCLQSSDHQRLAIRNFYGVVRVQEIYANDTNLHAYLLRHGTVAHGFQYIAAEKRNQPSSYYVEDSGIGRAITHHPQRRQGMRVGVLGLGIGSLAAYGQTGDIYRFYEINPAVAALAQGKGGYFRYLLDSPANTDIILGDARIMLEQQLAKGEQQHFDVLALDVFNSDAIPIHLLTREAFAVYLAHLAPDGILAINVTNHYLDLQPIIWRLARHYQLYMLKVEIPKQGIMTMHSSWILLARNAVLLQNPGISRNAITFEHYTSDVPFWTDDYSNLLQILK